MKFTPFFLWMILAGGVAFAAPPTSHRPDRYKDLYLNSALTDPPEVITNDPEPENDLVLSQFLYIFCNIISI